MHDDSNLLAGPLGPLLLAAKGGDHCCVHSWAGFFARRGSKRLGRDGGTFPSRREPRQLLREEFPMFPYTRAQVQIIAISLTLFLTLFVQPIPANELNVHSGSKEDKNIVAYWNFEASHNDRVANCVGGGLHGTLCGAVRADGALKFDGEDDRVEVRRNGKLARLSTGAISVWFKFDSIPYGEENIQPIFFYGDADGGERNSALIIEVGHFWDDRKATTLYFTIYGMPGQKPTFCFDSNFDLALDTWYHFVAVVGDDFNTGYLNGVELTDRHYNFGGPNDSEFFEDVVNPGLCLIGKGRFSNFNNPCHFEGMIDELHIFGEPLDSSQIQELYNDGKRGPQPRAADVWPRPSQVNLGAHAVVLHQNHPNPFNPTTSIRFVVPKRAHVNLAIANATGKVIATLLNRAVAPGPQEVEWDGRDGSGRPTASGVYFYRLKIGDEVFTRKMMLVK